MDESVAAATTVNYQADEIPWIYTVVPVGTPLPSYIQQEQIQELFLYNEEDGDAQDVDPWQPSPTPTPPSCTPAWDPYCNCYHPCPIEAQAPVTSTTAGVNPKATASLSNQAKATKQLKQAGISPSALYNEAMRISGHPEEAQSTPNQTASDGSQTSIFGGRYHPSGKILVQDTELGIVPLRRVEVKSRRWFQFGSAFTDSQGNFAISTSYHSLAKLSLNFKNNLATTRGIITGVQFWDAVLPISAGIGSYENNDMENVNYTISYIGGLDNAKSKGASTWTAAMLFNVLVDAQAYSIARGIPPPATGINVWLFPDFKTNGSGSTPMLRKIASTSAVSRTIDFVLAGTGMANILIVKQIIQRQLPDITIFYGGDQGALDSHHIVPFFYHELGHTQHYNQVGNSFWTAYIAHIVDRLGYGEKSDGGSGRIAISEGWGNYIENTFMIDKYTNTLASRWSNFALITLENQIPDDNQGIAVFTGNYSRGWFSYGMYHDMTDNTEPALTGVTDNVSAFTSATVFHGLQADVLTVRDYQARISAQNNGLQAGQMEQLVTSYRW